MAETIIGNIAAIHFMHDGTQHEIGTSVGITVIDKRSPRPEALMKQADAACYAAKANGRNQSAVYEDDVVPVGRLSLTA